MRKFGCVLGAVLLGALLSAGCGSSSKATANPASSQGAGAGNTPAAVSTGSRSAQQRHVGDTQTVLLDGQPVEVTLVKLFDTVSNPTFTKYESSDLDATSRYVGAELTFKNTSSTPEAIGLVETSSASDPDFDVTGQGSNFSSDQSTNHNVAAFDGCAPTTPAATLAPGASATYCVAFRVMSGVQIVQVDWNDVDTTNTKAVWVVP